MRTGVSGRRHRHQRGFTLFELLIAMTLSSAVVLIGAMGLSAAIDFQERALARMRDHEAQRAAQRTLRLEWEGRAGGAFVARAGWLEFDSARAIFPLPLAGVQRVRYRCEADAVGRLALTHELLVPPPGATAAPAGTATPGAGASGAGAPPAAAGNAATAARGSGQALQVRHREILLADLQRCELSYLALPEAPGTRDKPRWQQAWDAPSPPRLMRLQLAGRRGELPPHVVVARQ